MSSSSKNTADIGVVMMLPGVDQHFIDPPRLADGARQCRCLDELRPGADHGHQLDGYGSSGDTAPFFIT